MRVVVQMSRVLRCEPAEMMEDTGASSIRFLETRLQETLQYYAEPSKKKNDPLELKDFLLISKMFGYFDHYLTSPAGNVSESQFDNDRLILETYREMFSAALGRTDVDPMFLEFVFRNRTLLPNLLSRTEQDHLQRYLSERGLVNKALENKEI